MTDSTLSDFAEIVMGQSPLGEDCNTVGNGLPLLNGPTEYGPHHPTPVQFTVNAHKRARPGDILFCVRGSTTGRMNWSDREYAIGRGVAAIRHKKRPELQPFVRAVIEYWLPSILAQATGSTFPNVSANQLAGLRWPPLDENEQSAIALILGTLDDNIEVNRTMTETLEAMAQALFKSWFVDFDPVRARAEGCDPGLPEHIADLFPDSFRDSELGKIPTGWRVGRFGDVVELLRDQENPPASPDVLFRHFSIPAYDDGQWPLEERGESIMSLKYRVPPDVILLSKLNPEIERVWLVDVQTEDRAICSTEFLVLRSRKPYSRSYAYCFARSTLFRQQMMALVTGTSKSHQRAQATTILDVLVPIPTTKVVVAYDTIVSPLTSLFLIYRRISRSLAGLHGAMLPKLISGELRISTRSRVEVS